MDTSAFKRFVSKFTPGTRDECWEWHGELNERGYGRMKIGKKNKKAHRLSYEHFTGRSLGKLLCCHTCDNPSCVNPNHLFAGTHRDNAQDCVRKGRKATGSPPNKILSDSDCDVIRRFPRRYGCQPFLARWFGVSQDHINKIRTGQRRFPRATA